MTDNKKWTLQVNSNGVMELPPELVSHILQQAGLKSRKKRIVKKVLKRAINKALLAFMQESRRHANI